MKALLIILTLGLVFQVHAGEDRGGGGAFCINKKCMTVAEAGFRFKSNIVNATDIDTALPISKELYAEVKNIEQLLPSEANFNVSRTNVNSYVRISSYNVNKFQVYKKSYLDLFKKYGISSAGFELLAVSDVKEQKTYLLPEFYKAGLRTQALTLFHESAIREGSSVKDALILDGMILDYLDGKINAATLVLEKLKYKAYPGTRLRLLVNAYASEDKYIEMRNVSGLPLNFYMGDMNSVSEMSQAYPNVWKFILEVGGLTHVEEKVELSTTREQALQYFDTTTSVSLDKQCSRVGNKKVMLSTSGRVYTVNCSNGKALVFTPVLAY